MFKVETISSMSHSRFWKPTWPLTLFSLASLLIVASSAECSGVELCFCPELGPVVVTLECGLTMCEYCRDNVYFTPDKFKKNFQEISCPRKSHCEGVHKDRTNYELRPIDVKKLYGSALLANKLQWQKKTREIINNKYNLKLSKRERDEKVTWWDKYNKDCLEGFKKCPACPELIHCITSACKNFRCPSCYWHFCCICGLEVAPHHNKDEGFCRDAIDGACDAEYNKIKKANQKEKKKRQISGKQNKPKAVKKRLNATVTGTRKQNKPSGKPTKPKASGKGRNPYPRYKRRS